MKKLFCNLCGDELIHTKVQNLYFTVKIKSPFVDVPNVKAHCCPECYDKLLQFFSLQTDNPYVFGGDESDEDENLE